MKIALVLVITLFFSILAVGADSNLNIVDYKEVSATYNGTEEFRFKFTDGENQTHFFDDVSEDIDVDLYDEENVGKSYKITWEEEEIELTDDEDKPTGEKQIFLTITKLEELE